MKKKVPQMDSKHFEGQQTGVVSEEIKKWIELWPDVRKKVVSNQEAYQVLSGLGLRYRDPRTIKIHLKRILPLVNDAPISALIDLINDFESHMPVKEFMKLIRERLPVEELGPRFATLADVLIKEAPQPIQVINALGSILAGGFPFDATNVRK
jgi:hypothetical protein